MRHLSLVTAVVFGVLSTGVASGVTLETPTPTRRAEPMAQFTLSAMMRAQADVQVRRLHNLIVNKNGDDAAFDKLEKLQKKLHGSK